MGVSIIIAAYNVEKYIGRCLKSVINQTYENIEVIVVNDGSTDNTLEEILKIQNLDNRIKVCNQKNLGVMSARKNGFNNATKKYVLFVDGDDWLDEEAIEKLYNKAENSNSEIVCYKFIYINEVGDMRKSHLVGDFITFNKLTAYDFFKKIMLSEIIPSIWSKMIKREFIIQNNVEFLNNLKYAEDLAFSCELGVYKPRVSMLDEHLYYYFQRSDSVTKQVDERIFDIDKAVLTIKDILIKNNIFNLFKYEFEYLCFIQNFYEMMRIFTDFKCEYNKKIYKNWKKYNIKVFKNKFIINKFRKLSIGYLICLILFNINYGLGKLYYKLRRF